MTEVDQIVLDWYERREMAITPMGLYHDLPDEIAGYPHGDKPSYSQVYRRMNSLEEHGLLEKHPEASSLYRLSELGWTYLTDDDATVEDFLPEDEDDEEDDEDEEESGDEG